MSRRKRISLQIPASNSHHHPSIVSILVQKIPCCFACRFLSSKPKKQKTPRIHNVNANENIYILRLIKETWHQIKNMHWIQWSWLILNAIFAFVIVGLLIARVVTYIFSPAFANLVSFIENDASSKGERVPSPTEIFLTGDEFFYFVILMLAVLCEQVFAFIVVWYERAVSLILGYMPSACFVMLRIILMLVDDHTPYLITMVSVKAVAILLFSLHALALPRTFGWKTFNTVGGVEKNMFYYRHWETISTNWLADLQYTVMIVAMSLIFIQYSWWFLVLLLITFVANVIGVVIHKFVVQREIRIILLFFFVCNIILPVYFIYKVTMIVAGPHRSEIEKNLPQDDQLTKNIIVRIINISSTVAIFVLSRFLLNTSIAYHFFFMNGNLRQIFDEKFRERREIKLAKKRERMELKRAAEDTNTVSYKIREIREYCVESSLSCLGSIRYKSFGLVYVEPKTAGVNPNEGSGDIMDSADAKTGGETHPQKTNEPRV